MECDGCPELPRENKDPTPKSCFKTISQLQEWAKEARHEGKALCFCLLIFGSRLTGCGGLFQTMEPPRINVVNVTPKEIKLFEQIFELELRVQNPNEAALAIHGLSFELEVNDRRFAAGVSNENVTVDGFSSRVIRVEAVTTSWGILQQIAQLQKTGTPAATYRIRGAVYSGSPSVKLTFDNSGELMPPAGPAR